MQKVRISSLKGEVSMNVIEGSKFFCGYVECALWIEEIDNPAEYEVEQMRIDCKSFVERAGDLLHGLDLSQCGHDFWLTRNRHGVGFLDRDLEKSLADKLTDLSHSFSELNIYGEEQ